MVRGILGSNNTKKNLSGAIWKLPISAKYFTSAPPDGYEFVRGMMTAADFSSPPAVMLCPIVF